LAQYTWDKFSLKNVESFDITEDLKKVFINPWFLLKKSLFSSNSAEIIYKITYNFYSKELINTFWEIIIP
jgi:hypothetical protein